MVAPDLRDVFGKLILRVVPPETKGSYVVSASQIVERSLSEIQRCRERSQGLGWIFHLVDAGEVGTGKQELTRSRRTEGVRLKNLRLPPGLSEVDVEQRANRIITACTKSTIIL